MKKLLLTASLLLSLAPFAHTAEKEDQCPDKASLRSALAEHQSDIEGGKGFTFADAASRIWLAQEFDTQNYQSKGLRFEDILNLPFLYLGSTRGTKSICSVTFNKENYTMLSVKLYQQ